MWHCNKNLYKFFEIPACNKTEALEARIVCIKIKAWTNFVVMKHNDNKSHEFCKA